MSDEEYSEPEALLAPLDGEPGPMPALAAEQANALTALVVARWSSALSGVEPADGDAGPAVPLDAPRALQLARAVARRHARLRPWRLAGVAGVMLSLGGLALGALHSWESAAAPRAKPDRGAQANQALVAPKPGTRAQRLRVSDPASEATRPVAVVAEPVRVVNVPPTAAESGRAVLEEEATLERANGLRAIHNWRAAQRMYVRIAEAGTRPRERYVAGVAAAALCWQHTQQPRLALSLYARALRTLPQGDLSEDIRLGIAHAFNALNEPAAEANALREFLARHPDSDDATSARQRLAVLSVAPSP